MFSKNMLPGPMESDAAMPSLEPLRRFIGELDTIVRSEDELLILARGGEALAQLVVRDDWLPPSHATPDSERYRQYRLYSEPAGRYSIVSFVWGPGQQTPIHDHTVWGLIGVLRGAEISERFIPAAAGLDRVDEQRLEAGAVDAVSPRIGDIHRVRNAHDDRVSISIHVYGADIGTVQRHAYDEAGRRTTFISGYAEAPALSL